MGSQGTYLCHWEIILDPFCSSFSIIKVHGLNKNNNKVKNECYLAKKDAATDVVDDSLATYVVFVAGKLYMEGLSAL